MSDDAISLFPRWKQAVVDFMAEHKYGDLVSHGWLLEHFGMTSLEGHRLTETQFKRRQLDLMSNVEQFKHELLTKHQIYLQPVRGSGYRWATPGEQTGLATKEFERDAGKAFRAVGQRLRHVRLHELSDEQRRENSDAVAKVSQLRGMTRKVLK
ncbi:hypothetical protein [Acidovorax sp. SD340]|uniref:hypothetical protein n=1 Tax=Acidovorax sp. SD340 TaxID=1690268 RepID=UPI0006DC7F1A|nr:hypothetical protein [Acidovorax sp. SD340]KQB59367.1 hypothetical protein AE621_10640 [Acidovorax sp. SD340]MBO1007087.1 hypothetical protein [Acidovorax sp. SD340]